MTLDDDVTRKRTRVIGFRGWVWLPKLTFNKPRSIVVELRDETRQNHC